MLAALRSVEKLEIVELGKQLEIVCVRLIGQSPESGRLGDRRDNFDNVRR